MPQRSARPLPRPPRRGRISLKTGPRLSVVSEAELAPYAETLWGLLRTPFRALVERIENDLEAAGYDGIRRAHFRVLRAASGIEACSLSELAKHARITKQSAAYLIDHLEELGYVESVADPHDDRVRMIRLRPRGRRVAREMHRIIERTEIEWAGEVGARRFATFRRALVDLTAWLGERTGD